MSLPSSTDGRPRSSERGCGFDSHVIFKMFLHACEETSAPRLIIKPQPAADLFFALIVELKLSRVAV